MIQPLVSVVTAFYNVASSLAQSIESLLAQNYTEFEYILSDNCSTDGSREIAETYAHRDARIRLIRQPRFLSQVEHYNHALAEISIASKYCKMVQADDCIFPRCLQLMVQAFEQSETIGLVSSYYVKGRVIRGGDFPYPSPPLPGKEMARLYPRRGIYVFGSPSTVMYRSSLVREHDRFFDGSLLHEDTEKCVQILENWDFAFVHQVLSFLRVNNQSISSVTSSYQPDSLDWYIMTQRYAPVFLEAEECKAVRRQRKGEYYRVLAREAIRLRRPAFWKYHKEGLKTLGETVDWPYLALQIGKELLWLTVNPGLGFLLARDILGRLFRRLRVL